MWVHRRRSRLRVLVPPFFDLLDDFGSADAGAGAADACAADACADDRFLDAAGAADACAGAFLGLLTAAFDADADAADAAAADADADAAADAAAADADAFSVCFSTLNLSCSAFGSNSNRGQMKPSLSNFTYQGQIAFLQSLSCSVAVHLHFMIFFEESGNRGVVNILNK